MAQDKDCVSLHPEDDYTVEELIYALEPYRGHAFKYVPATEASEGWAKLEFE